MGRKLNLSEFTEEECDRILQVVVQDSILYKQEKERLSQIKADVEAEGTKYQVLAKSQAFNNKNCIRCFSRFWFIFNRKFNCSACRFHVCKKCYEIDPEIGKPICKACIKQRQYNRQSLDWFYSAVSKKFKHSGSTKVIRHLYRRRSAGNDRLRRSSSDSQMNRVRHPSSRPPWCGDASGRSDGSEDDADSLSDDVRSLCERRSLPNILSQRLLDEMNNNSSNSADQSNRVDASELAESGVQTELSLIRDDVMSSVHVDGEQSRHDVGGTGSLEWAEGSYSSDLLRLAADVTKSQGQAYSTATRMKHSADTLSSLYEEMDRMDERLDGLEDQMGYLNDDTEYLADQLTRDSHKIKSSAASVGMVTSDAMNVLSSAYHNHDSQSYRRNVEGAESEESNISLKYFRRLNSSERIESSPVGAYSSDSADMMNEHLADRRGSSSSGGSDEYIVNRESTDSDVFAISEMYSPTSSYQTDHKLEILRRQRSHSSRRSLNDLESTSDDVISLKEAEQEIYVAAGNVFSLEEQVKLLEERVLRMNEMTDDDLVSEIENDVARAAARVNQSDKHVTGIEELVEDITDTTTV